MQIILLLLFAVFFGRPVCAQKVTKRYFIGKWQSVDSSTGVTEGVRFRHKSLLFFPKSGNSKWRYAVYDKDSVVDLKYVISSKRAVLEGEGILVILNDTCFWWFNPLDYDTYNRQLHNGYARTHIEQFAAWLKERRDVYYRR
jgi:hypothetical protein